MIYAFIFYSDASTIPSFHVCFKGLPISVLFPKFLPRFDLTDNPSRSYPVEPRHSHHYYPNPYHLPCPAAHVPRYQFRSAPLSVPLSAALSLLRRRRGVLLCHRPVADAAAAPPPGGGAYLATPPPARFLHVCFRLIG